MEKYIVKSGLSKETTMKTGITLSDSHRYKTSKGEISCLHPCYATFDTYEIYCL